MARLNTGSPRGQKSRDVLRHALARRLQDGSRVARKDNELLTSEEYDALKRRYVAAGFSGSCSNDAKKVLAQGVVDILKSRGPGVAFTKAELAKISPGATPVSGSWCEKLCAIVKKELQERHTHMRV